ncbi:MAG: hypothetical protein IJQ59_00905 [Bacteroidaceae bacterium]|nr:hypothetical protein [Bacteroidaceae bacterium]
MIQFEDQLRASARRLAQQENQRLHVPQNPLQQKRTYWGWVAAPAAAVIGLVMGMSLHLFLGNAPGDSLARSTDTIRIFQPVHDTLYLTQVVEKERVVNRYIPMPEVAKVVAEEPDSQQQECTSIQCDGINYAILASK